MKVPRKCGLALQPGNRLLRAQPVRRSRSIFQLLFAGGWARPAMKSPG
jgi:hypothetical protein